MKVLRLYDYLGQLKKELDVYVEGEDFKWTASYPEAVWLGTIAIEEAGKEPEAVPVLEQALSLVEPEKAIKEPEPVELYLPIEEPITEEEAEEMQVDIAIDAMREQEMATKDIKEEVESEPKKIHRKRSRVKGTHPSDYLKSLKVIREDDTGGDTNQGD